MDKISKDIINQQLACNSHVNLYHDGAIDAFLSVDQLWADSFAGYTPDEKEHLISYVTEQALKALYGINQYYQFNNDAVEDLKAIYRSVFEMKERNEKVSVKKHARNIQNWLKKHQSVYQAYFEKQTTMLSNFVPCFEYSALLQTDLLGLNIQHIQQPVLDVGCGEKANLVHYLKSMNIDVMGIDRLCDENELTHQADWLEYDFQPDTWGTIISHLGFTNHFRFQHLQLHGNAETYAGKFMDILHSLKPGGSFYYSPGLEFIEQFLPANKYRVVTKNSGISDFKSVCICRIH